MQADGLGRGVLLHAPAEWGPLCKARVWKLEAPANALNDAPAAFSRPLRRYLLNSDLSMKCVGLRRQASTFDPCLLFVFRNGGQAVGALAAHIDDISGRGEPDVLPKMRNFSGRRFRELKLQVEPSVHVGVELVQDSTFPVTLTQGDFTDHLQPLGTSPQLRAARHRLLSPEDGKLRHCKLGELCRLATVSRPDICAICWYRVPTGLRCVSRQLFGENC